MEGIGRRGPTTAAAVGQHSACQHVFDNDRYPAVQTEYAQDPCTVAQVKHEMVCVLTLLQYYIIMLLYYHFRIQLCHNRGHAGHLMQHVVWATGCMDGSQ